MPARDKDMISSKAVATQSAFAILLAIGCAETVEQPDYFPLAVGREWTYQVDSSDDLVVMRVSSRTDEGFVLEGTSPMQIGRHVPLRPEAEGVRAVLGDDFSQAYYLLRYPLRPGTIWNELIEEDEIRARWRCEAYERVTVPAGTFDCVRVVMEVEGTLPGNLGWLPVIYFWFAPDVGLVKSGEGLGRPYGSTLYELKAYR